LRSKISLLTVLKTFRLLSSKLCTFSTDQLLVTAAAVMQCRESQSATWRSRVYSR